MRKARRKLKKDEFINKHKNLSDEEYKLELLYSQQLIYDKVAKTQSDVSVIAWIIVIIISLSLIGLLMSIVLRVTI